MTFQSPLYLLGLLVVPLTIGGYVLFQRSRVRTAGRFASLGLLPNLVPRAPGWRRHLPAAILLLALCALLVGVARPHATVSVRREEATIVLALDTSRSMGATDVKPTRLAAARAAAGAFLAEVPDKYRIAIVSFATKAQVAAAPTRDRPALSAALAALRTGEGTALGDAIALALRVGRSVPGEAASGQGSRPRAPPVSVLLLSDGAEMGGRVLPDEAARRARSLGIPVYTVALGTQDGIVVVRHVGGFVERIRVPPDPNTLRRIAGATRGRFFAAPDRRALKAVYRDLASRLGHERKKEDVTFAFAAGAAVLLLLGGGLSTAWFRRLP